MAKFVSNAKEFSVFLEMTEAGGKWADFVNGEYQTDNSVYAEKLRKFPTFGQDFYEVGHSVEESSDKYKCPFCDYTADTQRKVVTHSAFKKDNYHKKIALTDVLVV